MEFNPRMSVVRATPNAHARSRQQEEDNFMTLPEREIAGCINDIGIAFTVADLQKPNPQQIQRVFEWFAELLTNTTRDAVAPAMRAAGDDVAGPYSEIFTSDTRDLMGFFVVLRKLLVECGVLDFTFQDLYKPTRERLGKIFSYIINFIRFRESQTPTIDEHFNRAENTKRRIETLLAGNAAHEATLAELRRSQTSVDAALRERDARSAQLKSRLLELKRGQERVSERLERVRAEQARLKLHLEDKTTTLLSLRADAAKLRPYTAQPASALSAHLATLSASLTADRATAETLDRRARALATSSDAFATVTADIAACTAHLADLRRDLAADDAQAAQAAGTADTLAARSAAVRDLDRHERLLAKQLDNALRRTQRLRDAADARREDEARRMAELRRVNDEIRVERADAAREADRRRARVEQTEKRVRDLRERLDAEVAGVVAEYASMQAHVRGYMEEMEACIAV